MIMGLNETLNEHSFKDWVNMTRVAIEKLRDKKICTF
jgi:hypothetical protein